MELYIRLLILFTIVAAFESLLQGEQEVDQFDLNKSHNALHDDGGGGGGFGSNQAAVGGMRLQKRPVGSILNIRDESASSNIVHGSYSYLDGYGAPVTVSYTLDEKSYGPHFPTVEPCGGCSWHHNHVHGDGR